MHYIVVVDLKLHGASLLEPGTVVHPQDVRRLEQEGTILLPTDSPMPRNHAVAYYGDGFRIVGDASMRLPTLYVLAEEGMILHWVVGVESAGPSPRGRFGIATAAGTLPAPSLSEFSPPERFVSSSLSVDEIEVLGGICRLTTLPPAVVGLQVRALGNDLRVLWAAVSLCQEARDVGWR